MSFSFNHKIEINRKTTRLRTFEVCVPTHVSLPMFIMQVLASQFAFLANRTAEHTVSPLFWPFNCIKIGGHVALLSNPTLYYLYHAFNISETKHVIKHLTTHQTFRNFAAFGKNFETTSVKTLKTISKLLMVNMELAITECRSDCLKFDLNLPKMAFISLVEKHVMNCL